MIIIKRTQRFVYQETWVSNKRFVFSFPKAAISKITIDPTYTSCGTGTYVANTLFEYIQLRINGKIFIDINGQFDSGVPPWGWAVWREFYKQKNKVAMANNLYVIELPDALPKDAQIDLVVKCSTLAYTECTNALVYPFDIYFEMEDKVPGKVLIPFVTWNTFVYGTDIGHKYETVEALPYRLRAICFVVEDGDEVAVSTDITEIKIEDVNKVYFDGKMLTLESLQESRSGIALTDGYYIFSFPGGIKVPANSLKLDFYIPSAPGDLNVHVLYICY